jgi:hypothetical protein
MYTALSMALAGVFFFGLCQEQNLVATSVRLSEALLEISVKVDVVSLAYDRLLWRYLSNSSSFRSLFHGKHGRSIFISFAYLPSLPSCH